MKWIYWTAVVIVVSAGLGVSLYFGLQPRPVPKINLSEFSSAEKLGEALQLRLRLEIQSASLIFLGVQPDESQDYLLWNQFLEYNKEPGWKFDLLIVEPQLPHKNLVVANAHLPVEEFDMKNNLNAFALRIRQAQEQNKRVAVLIPSIYSTTLLPGNPLDRLHKEHSIQGVSFTVSSFPEKASEEKEMKTPCVLNGEMDPSGAGALGCFVLNKAKTLYRKKKSSGVFLGAVDQIGREEYLVLLNSPRERL